MKIIPHKKFKKQFRKLHKKDQKQFEERIKIFIVDPFNPVLNNHALHGKYFGYRSINITGILRIIYKLLDNDTALFAEIGTHGKLYS